LRWSIARRGPADLSSGSEAITVVTITSTTITATMTVSSTATTGSSRGITVTNNAAAGYGKVTAGVLSIT
jgi:hypothetical protein